MSRSLTIVPYGETSTLDYQRYLYDVPTKDDRQGSCILLDFALAPIDTNFVRPSRGNYVTYQTDTYGTWYTGYITNEPEYTYLGANHGVPAWGYHYQASSDDIILSQNALGIVPPFLNMTQGEILIALAEMVQPGLFDYSNVQPGQTLAMYVVNPTQKFNDVAQAFCSAAVYRCYGKNHQLFFVPQAGLTTGLVIDGNSQRFTPGNLTVKANSNTAICNDCVVAGNIEPQRFTSEYFVGDGLTGEFDLSASVYGVDSSVLLADSFTGSTFNSTNWNVYDEPVNYLQLFNGYVNVVGGTGDGEYEVHLDSANLFSLSGSLRIAHGEYDFVPQTTNNLVCGIIGGLWTQEPNAALSGCVFGLQVSKNSGVVQFSPIYDGVLNTSQVQVVQTNGQTANVPLWNTTTSYTEGMCVMYLGEVYVCLNTTAPGDEPLDTGYWAINVAKRYVIRTLISTQLPYRVIAQYNYRMATGGLGTYGGGTMPDTISVTTYVTELDPNTGEVTPGYPVTFQGTINATDAQAYAYYIPVASNDLHVTFTDLTISIPMQASLQIISDGPGGFVQKLVGPNEIDATDGLAPWATIADSGSGITAQQSTLGTPQYAFGAPKLEFFNDTSALTTTIPQLGDLINLTYNSAGASAGRVRNQASVNTEAANWGDSGIRSVVSLNGVTPQPQTSADCEAAAAATIGQSCYTHYQGTYEVVAQNCTGEPVSGSNLQFINLPLSAFPVSNFNEPITEVVTHFNATSQGEQFDHSITFGMKGDSQVLLQTLAGFALQANVFTPVDTAQTPVWIPPTSLSMAYAPEVTNAGLDFTNSGTYGTWQPSTAYALGATVLDPNGNRQVVVSAGTSGSTIPPFAWLIDTAAQLGSSIPIGQIAILNGVVTVTSIEDLTGLVNIGAQVAMADLTACTQLNGLTLVVQTVNGMAFTALVNLPNYALAGDTGTGTVTAVGTFKPITLDGGGSITVPNGGFESSTTMTSGAPPDWTAGGTGVGSPAACTYDTTTQYAGTQSLKISVTANGAGCVSTLSIPVVAGTSWVLTGALKTYSGPGVATLQLVFYNSSNVSVGSISVSNATSTWQLLTATGVAPVGAVSAILSVVVAAEAGSFYDGVGGFDSILLSTGLQWQLVGHAYGVDQDNFYYNAGQSPTAVGLLPTGGGYGADGYGTDPFGESLSAIPGAGFEVRYTDDSWGCDPGKNLAGRFTSQLFSLPRVQRNSVVFIRAYDARNLIRSSQNWLTPVALTYSPWAGSAVTQVYGNDPNGNTSLLNQVTLVAGTPTTQTTAAYAHGVGTSVVFTVSVKGPIGSSITLGLKCATILNGSASQAFVLCGQWQRISVVMVTTAAATESFTASIAATSATVMITGTWASMEMNTAQETVYCKTQDTQLTGPTTTYGAVSRFGASVHVGYPLIPPAPTGFVDPTDPSNPIINLILPAVAQDVWGIEIRASDNVTVLYSANLTDSGYAPTYTYANNTKRAMSFYLYTYNLLGEYSPAFNLVYSIPLPVIEGLSVIDSTKTLTWTSPTAEWYVVQMDATSSAFGAIIFTGARPVVSGSQETQTSEQLTDPNYFNQRWFRVIPYDSLGVGTPSILSHVYTPLAPVEFDGNEVVSVAPPTSPVADPVPPAAVGQNTAAYINQSWSDYKTNTGR